MNHPYQSHHRPALSAVFTLALAAAVATTSAQAALIEAGGEVYINNVSGANSSASSNSGPLAEIGSDDSADFTTSGSFRTAVDQNGTFTASTNGRINNFGNAPVNSFDIQAYTQYSDDLTNNTTVAQEQLVTINLAAGNAQLHTFDSGGAADYLSTSLQLDLSFGAASIYSSGYSLRNRGGNIVGVQTGTDTFLGTTNTAFGLRTFDWDAQVITLVLGTLDPGASSSFTYRYDSQSIGSISNAFCDSGEGSLCVSSNAFGDPVSFAFSTRAVGGPSTSVPEPGTMALLGFGLFALISSRRRRG